MTSVRVDAHHHFWDPTRRTYPWMGDELAAIRRPFGPKEMAPLVAVNEIDRTVLVQTISSLDETREFLATAHKTEYLAGVVGWVDLTDPGVADVIAELRASEGGEFLKGIRHQVHDEADPNWLHRDDVRRGIHAVGEAGLVYDVLVRTRELAAALDLVRALPHMRFVIDHLAKPRIAAGRRDPEWEAAMAPLAACDNVQVKVSGLVTEADWRRWTVDNLRPYVQLALEWFGPERCMFGSDWPVCLLAAGYTQVVDALERCLAGLTVSERQAVFGDNAVRVYRLA